MLHFPTEYLVAMEKKVVFLLLLYKVDWKLLHSYDF